MKRGINDISNLQRGNNQINQVRRGNTLVWQFGNIYSNAVLAFSLRDLGLGATNAIRVRRSSDNAEQDFTFTEITDGTLTTFTGANDGLVTTIYGQRNGINATQTIASAQPKIVDAGSLLLENAKPTIQFNGTSHSLDITLPSVVAQPFTIITVNKYISIQNFSYLFSSSFDIRLQSSGTSNSLNVFAGSTYSTLTPISSQSLYYLMFDGINSNVSYNDSSSITANLGSNGLKINSSIGSLNGNNLFGNISFQELIIFNNNQNANKASIQTNINNYYSIY